MHPGWVVDFLQLGKGFSLRWAFLPAQGGCRVGESNSSLPIHRLTCCLLSHATPLDFTFIFYTAPLLQDYKK